MADAGRFGLIRTYYCKDGTILRGNTGENAFKARVDYELASIEIKYMWYVPSNEVIRAAWEEVKKDLALQKTMTTQARRMARDSDTSGDTDS